MSRFIVQTTPLANLKIVQRTMLGDERGFLSRLFCAHELIAAGWLWPVAQINHTYTRGLGTLRGLHYQNSPHAEDKLVSCIQGEVWDVAVDIRRDSPTFLHWFGQILSTQNHKALLIPKGFAHGFQALTDEVQLVYLHSQPYHAASEAGLLAQDPRLKIEWPLSISQISARDQAHALLTDHFSGVSV